MMDPEESKVLAEVTRLGAVSIFWITENDSRAAAVQRLQDSGLIVRCRDDSRDRYPICVFRVREDV